MASDGEDIAVTPTESISSTTDTEEEEASAHHQSDLESEVEDLDLEAVPASSEDADMDELMRQLEDYTPTIPDALTMHTLRTVSKCVTATKILINLLPSTGWFYHSRPSNCAPHLRVCPEVYIRYC